MHIDENELPGRNLNHNETILESESDTENELPGRNLNHNETVLH